jgi:hypothetical protein
MATISPVLMFYACTTIDDAPFPSYCITLYLLAIKLESLSLVDIFFLLSLGFIVLFLLRIDQSKLYQLNYIKSGFKISSDLLTRIICLF